MGISSHIVPPSRIQEELDALWNTQDNKNKIRASLFNIIFFTKQSSRDDYVRKISSKLIEKFPARIFFISFDATSSINSLQTAVSVISTHQGEYNITCDLIEIFAKGEDGKQVPFVLLPHIIPDLPVYLVWEEDPSLENPLGHELKGFATRLIFDSESTEDLCRFSKAVMKIQNSSNCEIADLNWARLETWRDLLSATFSNPETIEQLQNTHSMTIIYNAQETPSFCHTKIQSLYLQTWIAARMGWEADKKRSSLDLSRFFYEIQGRGIEIDLQEVKNAKLPPGMIVSVEIKTVQEEHFSFVRDLQTPHQISFTYSTKSECALPTKFLVSKGESGQSLIKEICHKGTSKHYEEVLQKISDWNRGGIC